MLVYQLQFLFVILRLDLLFAGEPAQNQPEARGCLENEDGANNVPPDVVVDRNGQSQVAKGSCQHVSST